ncbi:MAG TPA: pyridoxamine 5'-phosphate oxidase family protein [Candidatus Acidoferrales bacterium]|nr:pyridoxamine 5'-phosphate oxidase family protein [Candidatus Acidoferrales bacterium]
MRITELNGPECREVLTRQGVGRLACARENQPYIVPIYYAAEDDCLYGFATAGRKIDWMRTNPRVCVQADEIRSPSEWQSVIVLGRYEELSDDERHGQARKRAIGLLARRESWWKGAYAADQLRQHSGDPVPVVFCVHISEITGHRAEPDPAQQSVEPPGR